MPEWWTYRLSDLIMFSPRAYYRMFEVYHERIWPVQMIALAMIGWIAFFRPAQAGRLIAGVLAVSWLWIALVFHLREYAAINTAAQSYALAFVIQAGLLVWIGTIRSRITFPAPPRAARVAAVGLALVAVVILPVAGLVVGRTWRQLELVGVTPDATAVFTLAVVALAAPRAKSLLVVPITWCVVSAATYWALGSAETWVMLAALVGIIIWASPSRAAPP